MAICILYHIIVAMKPMTHTLNEFNDNTSMKKVNNVSQSSHWVHMRWQPDLTATNDAEDSTKCIPNFRLANATIHCGIDNMSPISVTADGTQYCGGVKMKPRYCLLPTSGRWIAGPFTEDQQPPLPRRLGIHRYNNDTSLLKKRCKTMEEYISGGEYVGVGFDQEWVPKSCIAAPLSPFAWTQHTQCQTTITMIGDSHIRNIFTATIHGFRGMEAFVEAHADGAAKARGIVKSYEWRLHKNGTASDFFAVYENTTFDDPKPFKDCPCGDDYSIQKCLRIAFIFAATFNDQINVTHLITKWKSDLVIVSPGNAYEKSNPLSQEWTTRYDQLLEENSSLQLGVLYFPWGTQPEGREAALSNWMTNNTILASRMSLLEQSAMSSLSSLEVQQTMQGRKSFHFACGLGKIKVENDNIRAAEPCTDFIDTAQIRALITIHFNALSNSRNVTID